MARTGPAFNPSADAEDARFWRVDRIAAAAGGRWLVPPREPTGGVTGISIDSRALECGAAFIAIAGQRVDGHAFVSDALTQGAAVAIVQNERLTDGDLAQLPKDAPGGVLAVADPTAALQQLAHVYRDWLARQGITVIAVGGSNGKTTTRSLIHHTLSAVIPGSQAPKSFNNHLGVPLTLLATRPLDEFVVCELGTNHPGEIEPLARLVRPDIAVLTSLGREHLEHFGTFEAVVEEESHLIEALPEAGTAIVEANAWQTLQHFDVSFDPTHVITFGFADQAKRADPAPSVAITDGPHGHAAGQHFTVNARWSVTLPLLGQHNAVNAAAALAVGQTMGVDLAALVEALGGAEPVQGRMQAIHFGCGNEAITVIDDAYNANPDSMRAAIAVLGDQARATDGRTIAVLGDMLELGLASESEHRALGQWLAEQAPWLDWLITVGPAAREIAEPVKRAFGDGRATSYYQLDATATSAIAATLQGGDCALLKASRGIALEQLLPAIEQRFGAPD
jgi:UDP-N-acetylmuramoyl-tripeptide--D-alanyl-D-alanine ligase